VGAVGKSWRETTICNKISMPNLRPTHLQITVACAAERMPNLRSLFDPSKHAELVGNPARCRILKYNIFVSILLMVLI
jgi:hypothetical protein